jgi:hypothetical protein
MKKKITAAELKEILAAHAKWARGEEGGTRADLFASPSIASRRKYGYERN